MLAKVVNKLSPSYRGGVVGYVVPRVGREGRVKYTAMYRDIHGRRRSAGTHSSEKKAEKAWQRAEARSEMGRVGDPRRARQTLRHYVESTWFPNHVIELTTRENYRYNLDRYILPILGDCKIGLIMPDDVREWITQLQTPAYGARPPTIKMCKVILDAIFTTAFNDQFIYLHPGRGVKTPPCPAKPRKIITADQFDRIYDALPEGPMQLLVETDIESGLRWGELTELRVKDLDRATGMITVTRVVVQLTAKNRSVGDGARFVIKNYPKDQEPRRLKIAQHLLAKLTAHIEAGRLGPEDLLFPMPVQGTRRRRRPEELPDPLTLGWTEPNEKGRRFRHGTCSAYGPGKCRCDFCRDAIAAYRAARRANGKDAPRVPRSVETDGHIGRGWFRNAIWLPAVDKAALGFHVTPHGLRHAHASWLLSGGADIQVVKERLGHASITTTEKYLHSLPNADETALSALRSIRPARIEQAPAALHGEELAELKQLRATLAQVRQLHESLGLKLS